MKNLQSISIAFTTTSTSFIPVQSDHLVHVFVKNRRSDTSMAEPNPGFVANLLAWKAVEAMPPSGINPYLGCALALKVAQIGAPQGQPINVPLRTQPILADEVILPVVDVHLYSSYGDPWAFNYSITFQFEDGSVSYSPADEGIRSIMLDGNNPDYSGICREANTRPAPAKPPSVPAYLASVTLDFGTHSDDKAADTPVNVHIVNRLSATSNQDIVVAENILGSQPLPLPTARGPFTNLKDFPGDATVRFGQGADFHFPLASQSIALADIVLPVVYIIVVPTGDDRWIFDYRVTYTFSNGMRFASTTRGVCLDANSNKHAGAYNGPPLPTYAPPPPISTFWTPAVASRDKKISLNYVQQKLDELVNHRTDPLFKFRFDSIRDFGDVRESYYDLQTITPDPPPPGTLSPQGYEEPVTWRSAPTSIGFLDNDAYFNDVNCDSITISIDDPAGPLPVSVLLNFHVPFDMSYNVPVVGERTMTCKDFQIRVKFTLTVDRDTGKVDVLRWVNDISTLHWAPPQDNPDQVWSYSGQIIGTPVKGLAPIPVDIVDLFVQDFIDVTFTTEGPTDFGGKFQATMRKKIFDMLSTPSPITEKTPADRINDYVNAWLLGGVVNGEGRCTVTDVHVDPDGDTLHVVYTGPTYEPPQPADWPSGVDFSAGPLANIEHIVVLTKENRSFDSMLGYLSLPIDAGGRGRTDVDGLKGGEFNMLDGTKCPSFAFEPEDTIFSPNPPQDPQRTLWEIGNGHMDGFVEAFADQDGAQVAPRIMGYHTAANVPAFDDLSRDFAICHRWFAPHPGPTFPNRFYELTGRLNMTPDGYPCTDNTVSLPQLDFASPVMPALARTIFDYLPLTVTWRYFENGGYCSLRLFAGHTFDGTNIVPFDDPNAGFLALAKQGQLPNVSFIDPHFIDIPPGANCDEPPSDVKDGQALVRQIVEAVVSSPQWDKTLLIITYDEHGGFFDHVPPPQAAKVMAESAATYGVRVPAFVISPWVTPGSVFGHDPPIRIGPGPDPAAPPTTPGPITPDLPPAGSVGKTAEATAESAVHSPLAGLYFDHTSILKTIARRFMSSAPPYLGARYAAANDLTAVMTSTPRSGHFRPFIPYSLVYLKTNGGLEVQNDSVAAGAAIWQNTPNAAVESQQFRLEDDGNGHWYLRTRTGLYLTADATMTVTQQARFAPGGGGNPDAQRWTLTPGVSWGIAFTISNVAFPTKTLQPAGDSGTPGTAVVLGDREAGPGGAGHVSNAWQVTSPLLPPPQIITQH